MTNNIIIHQLIACVLFFNIVWIFENKTDKFKCSNILALWCSILLCIFTFVYIFTKDTYYVTLTIAIFLSYLILELIYGSIYFREHMHLITTYIHHIVYILLVLYLLYTYDMDKLSVLSLSFLVEIPTILLNLKRYYNIKSKLFNLAYGILFLIFRVLLNICIIYYVYNLDNLLLSCSIIALFAHIKVLYDWYIKYNKN